MLMGRRRCSHLAEFHCLGSQLAAFLAGVNDHTISNLQVIGGRRRAIFREFRLPGNRDSSLRPVNCLYRDLIRGDPADGTFDVLPLAVGQCQACKQQADCCYRDRLLHVVLFVEVVCI